MIQFTFLRSKKCALISGCGEKRKIARLLFRAESSFCFAEEKKVGVGVSDAKGVHRQVDVGASRFNIHERTLRERFSHFLTGQVGCKLKSVIFKLFAFFETESSKLQWKLTCGNR